MMKFQRIYSGTLWVLDTIFFRLFAWYWLMVLFIHIFSYTEARDSMRKESMFPFEVAVFQTDGSFEDISYTADRDVRPENTSYLAPVPNGHKKYGEYSSFSYQVIKQQPQQQLIQTVSKDDERTTWATYVATHDSIMPLTTRIYAFDYMPASAAAAFVVVQLLKCFIRYLIWRNQIRLSCSAEY
ncbi:hypothetical protein BHC57_05180 [Snodgrassella alvi]|uniref:Uncharacterized protein n=2 Tax=Snodgrassella alvi TaxID=1196083 RepID=A0A855FNF4_9NEIS|nr:hypothetical protein BHC57_05180 [Snodgrassella alvi]